MKSFSWSWTRLKNWRTCPKRHYELDIAKTTKDTESDAIRWGKMFHEAMAMRIAKGLPLPPGLQQYDYLPALIAEYKADVECDMAINDDFKPTGWFAPDTWLRAKIDVRMVAGDKAVALDWKTGKIDNMDAYEQLALTAQVIFSTYPEVKTVDTAYIWSKYNDDTIKTYTRDDMPVLWAKLLPEIKRMEQAAAELNYPPKPSGICKSWCSVVSCPYHGKGTR